MERFALSPSLSHKQIPFELTELKADGGLMQFSGYASTLGNLDHTGDVIMRGAFDATLESGRKRRLLWMHDMAEPIGVEQSLKVDDKGLFGTWKLSKTTRGLDAYELLKDGAVDSLSIGYMADDFEYDDAGTRLLKQIDLLEVSLVSIPANDLAVITQVKADQPFDQLLKQLADQLKLGVREAKALHARRRDDERELSERHIAAISEYLALAEACAVDLKGLLPAPSPDAEAKDAEPPTETPVSAESAPSAMSLRLALARRRLERRGDLEQSA